MATEIISALTRSGTYSSSASLRPAETNPGFQQQLESATRQTEAAQNAAAAQQDLPPQDKVDQEQVKEAVSHINTYVQNLQRDLQFEVNLELGHTVISVVDHETKEVIRQIPPEEAVERAKRLQEQGMGTGSTEGLLLKVQA